MRPGLPSARLTAVALFPEPRAHPEGDHGERDREEAHRHGEDYRQCSRSSPPFVTRGVRCRGLVNLGPGRLMRGFSFPLATFAWQTADFLARIAKRMRIIVQAWPAYEAYRM